MNDKLVVAFFHIGLLESETCNQTEEGESSVSSDQGI